MRRFVEYLNWECPDCKIKPPVAEIVVKDKKLAGIWTCIKCKKDCQKEISLEELTKIAKKLAA